MNERIASVLLDLKFLLLRSDVKPVVDCNLNLCVDGVHAVSLILLAVVVGTLVPALPPPMTCRRTILACTSPMMEGSLHSEVNGL
jgi:hypothetical protein